MYGLETIIAMNKERGDLARDRGLTPFFLKHAPQIDEMPPFPFPNMGDDCVEVDKLYERITTLFCDKSGAGGPDDPSLTVDQLLDTLRELFETHGPIRIAIEEEGQFQLYLGVWK